MDINAEIKSQLKTRYANNRPLERAIQFIYGSYQLDDYEIVLLDGKLKPDLKDLDPANPWIDSQIHTRLDAIAHELNRDEKGRSVRQYQGFHHTGFYNEYDDDEDHVYLEFFVIEDSTHKSIPSSAIRKVIKRNFTKYRITETSKTVDPENDPYFSLIYAYVENTLTRRKINVRVTKQELTYHMLIEKFRKVTCA